MKLWRSATLGFVKSFYSTVHSFMLHTVISTVTIPVINLCTGILTTAIMFLFIAFHPGQTINQQVTLHFITTFYISWSGLWDIKYKCSVASHHHSSTCLVVAFWRRTIPLGSTFSIINPLAFPHSLRPVGYDVTLFWSEQVIWGNGDNIHAHDLIVGPHKAVRRYCVFWPQLDINFFAHCRLLSS